MQVVKAVAAAQAFGHEEQAEKPRPSKAEGQGTRKVKSQEPRTGNLNSAGTSGTSINVQERTP
jgi:hypothetical protein